MLTEDYIMRMISMAIAALMTALGLKRAGKYKESLQAFEQAVEGLCGVNARLADQLEESLLLDRLTFMGRLDVERVAVLADVYKEESEVYTLLGEGEKAEFTTQRSLRLYLEAALVDQAEMNAELIQKIEGLRVNLHPQRTFIETRMALQDYLDRLIASSDEYLVKNNLVRSDLQTAQSALDSLDQD